MIRENDTSVVFPDYAVSPGDFLEEWMEEEWVTVEELASRLNASEDYLSWFLEGEVSLTHSMSESLERVTGVPSQIWCQYEANFRNFS